MTETTSTMTADTTKTQFLTELPKCEHHVHLEGTLEPELLFKLAKRNKITLPASFPQDIPALEKAYHGFGDLQDFLDLYYVGMSVLITEEDFEDLAWAYLTKAASQGLQHAEVFFDPQGHTGRGISQEVVINGFHRALERAETELNVSTKLIMCLLRHLPPKDCLQNCKDWKPYYENGWISGMGLDSSEKPFPPENFKECYDYAAANYPEGTLLTAHAGEEGSAEYVKNALDVIHCTRIDHGIHSADDPELLKRLAKQQTMLSVCPLSNYRLKVVSDVADEPLDKFVEAGVPFSLNSDDPAYFGGYILDNYLAVEKAFHFSVDVWIWIAQSAVKGSICSDERKKELLANIDTVRSKFY